MTTKGTILWVDDEIDLLKPHIMLLEQRGYAVRTATNGADAVALNTTEPADLIFLDEMMPGMGGLETLIEIKARNPETPVVMVTKSEEEDLMEQAIGKKISDYLTKPVNPTQVLLAVKKFLEGKQIVSEAVSRDYTQEFAKMGRELMMASTAQDWIDLYSKLVGWEMELDAHPDLGLTQTLADQKREMNAEFAKFFERNYKSWVNTIFTSENKASRPALSPDIAGEWVLPVLREGKRNVVFLVIDCMRLDQWMIMEREIASLFKINRNYHFGIIPSATPYARNSIFSGSFPSEFGKMFPDTWTGSDDEFSQNKDEAQMLRLLLERQRVKLTNDLKYIKIIDRDFGAGIAQNIVTYARNQLTAIVVNFVDMLAHHRSDSPILKEIAPDERAYRSLTRSWFLHSSLYEMFKSLAQIPNVTVVVTTDHGSVRSLRGAKVLGDRETSTSLRYKYGRNVKAEDKQAMFIKKPEEYKLPSRAVTTNYIIAKEDYYFVYPTDYHKYLNHYKDTFQHGGISMEELILPVVVLEPK
ncbi:MAG: bifunctional response regulator/alkaline phosphatase family protein [Bacteroidetes bacterium]|nr:bifunctional response regulator/alkaline phosphatase family protein [Bacteroidota bacterium]